MFRLALLAIAAVKAEETSESVEMAENETQGRQLLWSSGKKTLWEKIVRVVKKHHGPKPDKYKLKAKITNSFAITGGKIVIKAVQRENNVGSVVWKVKGEGFDSTCPDGLNWHIHLGPGTSTTACVDGSCGECGPSVTGGHTDPTFGCGGASNNNGDLCTNAALRLCRPMNDMSGALKTFCAEKEVPAGTDVCGAGCTPQSQLDAAGNGGKPWSASYGARCSPATPFGCEYGDLSGKLGKINPDDDEEFQMTYPADRNIGDLRQYAGQSIVVHCCRNGGCSERAGCAVLEEDV